MHLISKAFLFRIVSLLLISLLAIDHSFAQSGQYKTAFSAYQIQDFNQAETIWNGLAETGDANAQYALGVMHLRGEARSSSKSNALEWFSKAAAQGHATAMFNVGVAYWEGAGIEQDRNKALKWWEQSAENGDSGAQLNLGLAYYIGEERERNLQLAAQWIGMAAEQNHPEAKRIMKVIAAENPKIAGANSPSTTNSSNQQSRSSPAPQPKIISQDVDAGEGTATVTPSSTVRSSSNNQTTGVANAKTPAVLGQTGEPVQSEYWKIIVVDTPLLSTPDNDGLIISKLPNGTPVDIIARKPGWVKITLPAGLKMWIFGKYLDVTANKGVVNASGVRARPQPSTDKNNSPPVGAYRKNDRVTVLEKSGAWYRVRAPKYIGVWVSEDNVGHYNDTPENRRQLWQQMISKGL